MIKKPNDLKTCRKALLKGKFKRYEDFFRDIQLIWDNCKTYNIQGSDIYKLAEHMEKTAKKAINKCKEELGFHGTGKKGKSRAREERKGQDDEMIEEDPRSESSDSDGDEVPFEQKVQFTEKVRRLTNEGLTRLVKMVRQKCKEALEDVDAEKLHI